MVLHRGCGPLSGSGDKSLSAGVKLKKKNKKQLFAVWSIIIMVLVLMIPTHISSDSGPQEASVFFCCCLEFS